MPFIAVSMEVGEVFEVRSFRENVKGAKAAPMQFARRGELKRGRWKRRDDSCSMKKTRFDTSGDNDKGRKLTVRSFGRLSANEGRLGRASCPKIGGKQPDVH